jgi:hypothetical protein
LKKIDVEELYETNRVAYDSLKKSIIFMDNLSIIQPEMVYNGQSCKNYAVKPYKPFWEDFTLKGLPLIYFAPTVGDTTYTNIIFPVPDDVATPTQSDEVTIKSDCAIKQNIPKEYQ